MSSQASRERRALARLLSPRRAVGRLVLSTASGLLAGCLAPPESFWTRGLVGWDVGASVLLLLTWSALSRDDAQRTQARCAAEDPGRRTVFAIALGSSFYSLFASLHVLHVSRHALGTHLSLYGALSLVAVALSWLVTHTAFTLRYAHLHYETAEGQGLVFPGASPPADLDFAYFAFTVGMCFQVSDVAIASSRIRREVLVHALLSFVYNTVILATAVNVTMAMF